MTLLSQFRLWRHLGWFFLLSFLCFWECIEGFQYLEEHTDHSGCLFRVLWEKVQKMNSNENLVHWAKQSIHCLSVDHWGIEIRVLVFICTVDHCKQRHSLGETFLGLETPSPVCCYVSSSPLSLTNEQRGCSNTSYCLHGEVILGKHMVYFQLMFFKGSGTGSWEMVPILCNQIEHCSLQVCLNRVFWCFLQFDAEWSRTSFSFLLVLWLSTQEAPGFRSRLLW